MSVQTDTPTPEAFLALPSDPEDDTADEHDQVVEARALGYADPLSSIAASLQRLTEFAAVQARSGPANPTSPSEPDPCEAHATALATAKELIAELRAANADRAGKHAAAEAVIDQVLEQIRKSTSKLANEVRATIEAYRNPPSTASESGAAEAAQTPPAPDADVEAWASYAEALGHAPEALEHLNRSQIRTLLGLAHPSEVQ